MQSKLMDYEEQWSGSEMKKRYTNNWNGLVKRTVKIGNWSKKEVETTFQGSLGLWSSLAKGDLGNNEVWNIQYTHSTISNLNT